MSKSLSSRMSAGWGMVAGAHAAAHAHRYCVERAGPDMVADMVADVVAFAVAESVLDGRDVQAFLANEAGRFLTYAAERLPTNHTNRTNEKEEKDGPEIPAAWSAPAAAAWEALLQKIADRDISDDVLLDTCEATAKLVPRLFDEMDIDALAGVFEAAMGQAAVRGALAEEKRLPPPIRWARPRPFGAGTKHTKGTKGGVATFAVEDGPAIEFAPLEQAVAKLGAKRPAALDLGSKEWSGMPLAFRERSQFSAHVESARFLGTLQTKLMKRTQLERERVAKGSAFVDRDSFIRDMRAIAETEGLETTDAGGIGTVRDIRSVERLGLIYDTQTRSAAEHARWTMGQDPDVLNEFPAWRFVRVQDVETARDEHAPFEGKVALKTDLDFWIGINQDFGVPWGPWGWGCGHDVEDVDRDEAEELGLIAPGAELEPAQADFNDRLQASMAGLSDELRAALEDSLGDAAHAEGEDLIWGAL